MQTEPEDEVKDLAKSIGDIFKQHPYFDEAEPHMDNLWNALIWPMLSKIKDFSCILDLAAGHGRNSRKLRLLTDNLIIVDINQECIDACKKRFGNDRNIRYVRNDGISLAGIADESVSLLYCFDAMVHFDNEVVRSYMREFYRVLKLGGYGFCHHSNYTGNPGGSVHANAHARNFMSRELFAHYCIKAGLQIIEAKTIEWGGYPNLDCLTLFQKPGHERDKHS